MSGRLKHPISPNSADGNIGIKRRPFENDNSNSSTERPLGKINIYNYLRHYEVPHHMTFMSKRK